ncbi:uncharacterized protein LOC123868421 [Maniola jurtina]|uniref:uncharacterized protein LOC123868421 n=1 Tax=Maniola jurtina TaxID=191418 RepID=UPI001E68BCE0|nr:uncharacterized protein LOC123868421 [Maniola jurtina]
MSEESLNVTYSPEGEDEMGTSESANSPLSAPNCTKLQLQDHIKAFMEKTKLEREVETLTCSSELIDKVVLNYIIAKKILSNLSWQDKLLCKQVCSTWHSAVQALRREQLGPVDFLLNLHSQTVLTWAVLKKSGEFSTEPLVVMTFVSASGLDMTCRCRFIEPTLCFDPECQSDHSLLDALQIYTSGPKKCMNTIRTDYLSYMPLPTSVTYEHTFLHMKFDPYMVGVFIPVIPDVKFHTINIKCIDNMQQEFYDVVREIANDRIFKGIFVYVTDKYLLHSVEDIVFLNHFKEVQPDIPYAIGGCIIEDAFEQPDIANGVIEAINEYREFFSENLISISVFTVPKSPLSNEFNFDMYSLVLDSSYWSKEKIQQGINEFSKRVPQFEYSVAIKLACVGRDKKHKWEQDCFRAVFPNTRIVGCYGNGELGVDHPPKPPEESPHSSAKRHCRSSGPQFGIVYSYSSVFVYMGWGKILSNGPC